MNWEKLTAPAFWEAINTGVCLVGLGVVEKHGDHLPLGQDYLTGHRVCTLAAEREPAVVFPPFYFGRINEARHVPGTIALRFDLLLPVLESVCDEIARNGLRKIILANFHGGNTQVLAAFVQSLLDKDKDYMVYSSRIPKPTPDVGLEAAVDGHAGEAETSASLHLFPELVTSDTPAGYGMPLKRLADLNDAGIQTALDWYADQPGHLKADGTPGSKAKGKALVDFMVDRLVKQIRAVKADQVGPELYRTYRSSIAHGGDRGTQRSSD